jgi:thiamine-phosphate pyrophosphorylase
MTPDSVQPAVARIIDANVNRAREAARVMEDHARFVGDDPAGCEALKRFRHDFADAVRRLPAAALLAARDTPGDVGTRIATATERSRPDEDAVFTAAAKRLPEALRTIEEYVKTFDAALSALFEALRYRAYTLEQRIVLRGERASRFAKVRLYVIVTESLCAGDPFETARAAIRGGAACIQLREKGLEDRALLERARRMAAVCREAGALFIVNDRPDLARLSGADGVHLGQTDMAVADARRVVGPERLIGVSTHDAVQLRAAVDAPPDYIAVGPMFASATKPQDHVPGPALLAEAVRLTEIPIVPIGGITFENVNVLDAAGARRVCVCSAVIGADDVRAAAARFTSNRGPA